MIERPEHLRGGDVPMNDVLLNDIDQVAGRPVPADATAPTRCCAPTTITRAVEAFLDGRDRPRLAVLASRRCRRACGRADGRPINHDPGVLLRTQDLPPVYEENSCLYLFTGDSCGGATNRIGERPMLFEIDA